uniref:RCC1-like domain-containing protein n=1 Tax=Periophthalmus magnuspinnatus TaxID=409849 RepID=A0A3B4A2T5_9GOBI
ITNPHLSKCIPCTLIGANSYGQLGQGHVEDQSLPQPAETTAFQVQSVRTLSGGGGHSVVVTGNGEVFVCGQNNKGQLGLGHTLNVYTLELCPSLRQKITNVSCGWDFTLLLSDTGQLLACGSNTFGQLGIGETVQHSSNWLIVQVSIGRFFLSGTIMFSGSGSVYQWGTGLCSHAKRVFTVSAVPSHFSSKLPCLVPGLAEKNPCMVAAGMVHCLYLTEDGELFMWGSNKHGQLTSSDPFVSSPISLKRCLLGGEKITSVWSGWTHNVAQTESGRVFTWGRGIYGQLGHTVSYPIPILKQYNVSMYVALQIACGSEHNLAIVGSSLFSWGWNEHGMCGDGSHTDALKPCLIPGLHPLLIGCGAGHSLALCTATTPSQ